MTRTWRRKMLNENIWSYRAPFRLRTTNISRKQTPDGCSITNDQFCGAESFRLPKREFREAIHWRLFFFFQRTLQNRRKATRVHIFDAVLYWYGKSCWKQFLRWDKNIWLALSQLKITKNLCHFLLVKHCTKNEKRPRWVPKNVLSYALRSQ